MMEQLDYQMVVVKKYDLRPSAYGDVDELNSFIGLSINCINKREKIQFFG